MELEQANSSLSSPPTRLTEEQMNQLQASLIEMAHDAIIIRDATSCVIAWNQGAQALYGWSEEEALGQETHRLLATQFPEAREAVDFALMHRGRWEGRLMHTSRAGEQLIVDSRQVLIRGNGEQPTAILEVNRDITEQMRLSEERTEVEATAIALRETTHQMETFLSVVSHELKTPLTAISGNVQLARRQLGHLKHLASSLDTSDESPFVVIATFLDRAERQINVQSRLVNDLVDSSRIQNNYLELQLQLCDLVTTIEQVVEEQRSMVPSRTIHWYTSTLHAMVLADSDRIGQVISNYLSNALKYSARDKPVSIALERENSTVRVSVTDEGPGLSSEQQEHIWERFFRIKDISTLTGSVAGLGLGLYICRNLIERQGGEVGVNSEPGSGSTFWFTLPLVKPDNEE